MIDQVCEWSDCSNDGDCVQTYVEVTPAAYGGAACSAATIGDTQTCSDISDCGKFQELQMFSSQRKRGELSISGRKHIF